jgi:hypothetical protein
VDDRVARVSELLQEAGEIHHRVYRIADGDDLDWASWYADWLINLSELPEILGTRPVRSELIYMLVKLDKEFAEQAPEGKWQDHYARLLVERFAG